MADNRVKSLRAGLNKALGIEEKDPHAHVTMPEAATRYFAKHPQLKGVAPYIVRKAWFTMSHLLLAPGAHVADMGCEEGAMTYVMAVLNPQIKFTGVDLDEAKIEKAKAAYKLPNLRYKVANAAFQAHFDHDTYDAMINSFVLHEIYSGSKFSDRQVQKALEQQFSLLKQEGWIFVRDYALHRPPQDFVLMELPDAPPSGSDDVAKMNEGELLVWFAHNARPMEDSAIHGFFLEELEPREDAKQTRLFRLPYKWAYEFLVRKDNRAALQAEIHKEYSFFTEGEFNKALKSLGARVLYSAPHWDDDIVSRRFEGRVRLFDEEGRMLGPPPTSFITVAQKLKERTSLALHERRPSQTPPEKLRVTSMRNEQTGRIIDVVSQDRDVTEIIPYRVTPEGQLHIFVHEGLPRGIVNAVPRNSRNLDGRAWSGHMIEAITIPSHIIHDVDHGNGLNVYKFAKNHLGLKPEAEAPLEQGQSHYPAPDYIDEVIKTRYLRVREQPGTIELKTIADDIAGFASAGRIREMNAQKIVDAASVGLIPNARLELQILALYEKLKLPVETWEECPLAIPESDPETLFDARAHMKLKAMKDDRYQPVKNAKRQLRPVQSTFVDEGFANGGITGLASRDVEFIVSEDQTLNKAAILPLTKKSGQIMVGFEVEYLPVPQRVEGNGLTARAPTVTLPKDVTTVHQARKYVADMFGISVNEVWRLGESYFCHAGVTPQRIFPFAIACKESAAKAFGGNVAFAPMKYVFRIFNNFLWKGDMLTMWAITRARRRLGQSSDMSLQLALGWELAHQIQDPGVLHVASMAGMGGGGGAPAAGGGAGGFSRTALAAQADDDMTLEELLGEDFAPRDDDRPDSLRRTYRSNTSAA